MAMKEKAQSLAPMATEAQKETLNKVDNFLAEVTSFQKEVNNCIYIEGERPCLCT